MAKSLKLATEMMCTDAGLHADQAGWHIGEAVLDLPASNIDLAPTILDIAGASNVTGNYTLTMATNGQITASGSLVIGVEDDGNVYGLVKDLSLVGKSRDLL